MIAWILTVLAVFNMGVAAGFMQVRRKGWAARALVSLAFGWTVLLYMIGWWLADLDGDSDRVKS